MMIFSVRLAVRAVWWLWGVRGARGSWCWGRCGAATARPSVLMTGKRIGVRSCAETGDTPWGSSLRSVGTRSSVSSQPPAQCSVTRVPGSVSSLRSSISVKMSPSWGRWPGGSGGRVLAETSLWSGEQRGEGRVWTPSSGRGCPWTPAGSPSLRPPLAVEDRTRSTGGPNWEHRRRARPLTSPGCWCWPWSASSSSPALWSSRP